MNPDPVSTGLPHHPVATPSLYQNPVVDPVATGFFATPSGSPTPWRSLFVPHWCWSLERLLVSVELRYRRPWFWILPWPVCCLLLINWSRCSTVSSKVSLSSASIAFVFISPFLDKSWQFPFIEFLGILPIDIVEAVLRSWKMYSVCFLSRFSVCSQLV